MDGDLVSSSDIAEILGVSSQAAKDRAEREGWPVLVKSGRGRGGARHLYPVEQLPADIRAAIEIRQVEQDVARAAALPANCPPKATAPHVTPAQLELCHQKAALVRLFRQAAARKKSERKIRRQQQAFADAYNRGPDGPYPVLFAAIGEKSRETLSRWDRRLRQADDDPLALLDTRGQYRRGEHSVIEPVARALINASLSPNRLPISEAIRAAKGLLDAQGLDLPQSDRTCRRFIEKFKVENYDKWVFLRQGSKALNDLCSPHLTRDPTRLDVGDVMVADGHTLNWTIINPMTGKPARYTLLAWYDYRSGFICGFDLSPSENTEAIALSLYRAILTLGKMPRVAYVDNGRPFRAKFFNNIADFAQTVLPGALQALGIQVTFAWPYHAESKPVERLFETFAELERRAPTYVGTSIEKKPPRLLRNEKVHRALHDRLTGGRVPTLIESYEAIARWFDLDYHPRPAQSGQRKGFAPGEVFEAGRGPGFSEDDLQRIRLHLSPVLSRRVFRDGIKVPGVDEFFYHPDLYGRQQQTVVVRYDWVLREKIWVYDQDGNFLCAAERRGLVHPAARILGSEEDQSELQRRLAEQRSLKKTTIGRISEMVNAEVVPDQIARQHAAGFERGELPGNAPQKLLPFKPAAEPEDEIDAPELTEAEREQQQREFAERCERWEHEQAARQALYEYPIDGSWLEDIHGEGLWESIRALDDFRKFRELRRLRWRLDIPSDLEWFRGSYPHWEEYREHVEYFENDFEKMMMEWQTRGEPFTKRQVWFQQKIERNSRNFWD